MDYFQTFYVVQTKCVLKVELFCEIVVKIVDFMTEEVLSSEDVEHCT